MKKQESKKYNLSKKIQSLKIKNTATNIFLGCISLSLKYLKNAVMLNSINSFVSFLV